MFSIAGGSKGLIEGITGWCIGEARAEEASNTGDASGHARCLYRKLEEQIIPLFYQNQAGYEEIMRHAIAINGSFFNTQRMLHQYVVRAYFR